jgi:hypothetical protein
MTQTKIGKYLSLDEFCMCTNTYKLFSDKINPFPQQQESIEAIKELNTYIIDPIIDNFGLAQFKLTYGFCSVDLKKYLSQKDPKTGIKYGRIAPEIDQHMCCEKNQKGNFFCTRLGAACDFKIINTNSDSVISWIYQEKLPFDRMYFYGKNRPIHISYGSEQSRYFCMFYTTQNGNIIPRKISVTEFLDVYSK